MIETWDKRDPRFSMGFTQRTARRAPLPMALRLASTFVMRSECQIHCSVKWLRSDAQSKASDARAHFLCPCFNAVGASQLTGVQDPVRNA